jgi:hypothetical protein
MTSSLTNTMNITDADQYIKCYDKCLYSYNYPNSNFCTFTNVNQQYFNLSYTNSSTNPPANFYDTDYNVDRVCIYFPSLHNFNNYPASGEVVIYHSATDGTKLNVCIPLIVDGGTSCPLLNNIFNEIISNHYTDNDPHTLSLDIDYTLNDIVKYAPYYSYVDNNTKFVVYGIDNGIFITKSVNDSITSTFIKTPYQPFQTISYVTYNNKGPYNTGGNEIFIDCQPVDKEGNLLIDKSNKDFYKMYDIGPQSITMTIIFSCILFALIILVVVMYLTKNYAKKVSEIKVATTNAAAAAAAAPPTTSPIGTNNTILSRNFELGFDGIARFLGFSSK